ncbi:protein ITPRID1 isoform X2 [Sphaerodactylus townsendi]|uniref:protein ITPRID1 isoform X2 n=1 Tax=Sphaerodactylus townsendi TaxID=933632 RepID=UPI002025D94E|nr:protein ITPRID1 isoform X2 [Sphaerodactylus townsendi]
MSSKTHHHGININNINSERGMCLPTQAQKQLGEGLPAPKAIVDTPRSSSRLVDHAEENICNWMDSGFFLSASPDLQGSRDKAALSPPLGMVQMTVQNYMQSLHRFSEMPVLSRWNGVNTSQSHPSAPKSVTEWLDFSKKDPVEILLDLGFGMDEPDICTKIPSRFISSASMAKGINIRVFIEAQKHRMDLESPNLCGRFLQLEVLDHVTSAFSSLLNDINLMQKNTEDRNGEGRGVAGTPKGKVVVSQAKRRRIGQLLRKVSRQTTTCGPPAYRTADSSGKTSEDGCPFVDVDKCISARSALCEHTTLDSLKEEMFPSDEEEKTMTLSHPPSKIRLLPHLPSKQTHFLSTSEMPIKDRPRKEPSLLVNYMLKRVSGLNGKPSDSFEMEEIQSFEDESSWGNPLESTSDTIVTRTNSCQSDSSGFLEDPSDPLPLQVLSLPGNKRLSCNAHDNPAFLRHRKESPQTSQDSHSQAEISVAVTSTINDGNNLLLPTLSREQTFQGEEVFCSINEEDDLTETSSGQYEDATSETEDESHEREMQGQRGQLRKEEDRCAEGHMSCHQINNMGQDNASSLEGDWPSYTSKMHGRPGSAANEVGCTTPMTISNDQLCTDLKDSEGLLTEEETGKVCRENEQEGTGESVEGKRRDSKLGFPCPATDVSVTNDYQESVKLATGFGNTCGHLDIAPVPGTEQGNLPAHHKIHTISMSPLQDSTLSTSCLENGGINSLNGLSASTKLDKDKSVPALNTNRSPFRSVTVQMPSLLFSSTQSIHLDDAAAKGPSLDFTSKASQHSEDEPLIFSVSGAFKEEDKEVKDVCIQTERSRTKRKAFPPFPFPPSFHGHSHLVKSASLDTGLHGEYRSGCCEPFHAWCAQHGSHCYPLSPHHCCLLQSLPLAPLCKHHATCYSSHATLELQLLKTLRLLQDTAMRNVSSCTVHEIEDMKNSCQKFRERLDEIELHLTEQEIHLSSTLSDKGREERRHLQSLRQAVRREVAELECQLKDRARQQLDQLLDEQSNLCSELGLSGARSEHSLPEVDAAATSPFLHRAGCSKDVRHRPPRRSSTVPPSPSVSLLRKPEASPLPQGKTDSTTDSKERHGSKKETKGLPQAKLDFKAFIQNLKKSFRNSFNNDATEGKD